MNHIAKVSKQSVFGVTLMIISLYLGLQFGTKVGQQHAVATTLEHPGYQIILADDGPKPCPSGC